MEVKKAFIVLIDISGYTRFIKLHKFSLLHAEGIINELLESVIQSSDHPLVLNKLQGDAALFYAVSDESAAMAQAILEQVMGFFDAFRQRERALISDCGLCVCDACMQVGQLRLKAIVHHGEVAFKQIAHFEEIAGVDVILAHRLLKNSIAADEYLLLSEPCYQLSHGLEGQSVEIRQEQCEGIGEVKVMVYYPEGRQDEIVAPQRSFLDKLKMSFKLESHTLKRLLRPAKVRYQNLEQAQKKSR